MKPTVHCVFRGVRCLFICIECTCNQNCFALLAFCIFVPRFNGRTELCVWDWPFFYFGLFDLAERPRRTHVQYPGVVGAAVKVYYASD